MTQAVDIAALSLPEWQTVEAPPGVGSNMIAPGPVLFGGAVVANPGAAAELVTLYDTSAVAGNQLAAVSVPPGDTKVVLVPWPGVQVRGGVYAVVGGADLVVTVYVAPTN